jgi:hypothetical protein
MRLVRASFDVMDVSKLWRNKLHHLSVKGMHCKISTDLLSAKLFSKFIMRAVLTSNHDTMRNDIHKMKINLGVTEAEGNLSTIIIRKYKSTNSQQQK